MTSAPDNAAEDRHPTLRSPSHRCFGDRAETALDQLASALSTTPDPRLEIPAMRACIRAVSDETAILERLGPALVFRFFSLLEGKTMSRPYFFPAGMLREHLGVYLDLEINHHDQDYQAECVLEFMTHPLLEGRTAEERRRDFDLGCNLAISYLRACHLSFARLIVTMQVGAMRRFLSCVDDVASSSVRRIFIHLFGRERIRLVDRYACAQLLDSHQEATAALRRLQSQDIHFFHRL